MLFVSANEKRLQHQVYRQKIEIELLRKKLRQATNQLRQIRSKLMDYTNLKHEMSSLEFLVIRYFNGSCSDVPSILKSFTMDNHLLLILMKLKLGASNGDLSLRYNIKEEYVSKIVRTWLSKLANVFAKLIIWPEREALKENQPACFSFFKNCVCIIDCTEIYIERPLNLKASAQTFSNYKSHNTIKYLIGITLAGAVSFLSGGWGGRASDKEITLKSGFLDKLTHGDCVLADRGFLVEEELATRGAVLRILVFTRGKKQMTAKDIDISRQIEHVRILIGRLKKFKILNTTIPIPKLILQTTSWLALLGLSI